LRYSRLVPSDYEAPGQKPVEMATYFERGSEQSLKPTGIKAHGLSGCRNGKDYSLCCTWLGRCLCGEHNHWKRV